LCGGGRYWPGTAFDGNLRLSQGFPAPGAVLWPAPDAVAAIIAKFRDALIKTATHNPAIPARQAVQKPRKSIAARKTTRWHDTLRHSGPFFSVIPAKAGIPLSLATSASQRSAKRALHMLDSRLRGNGEEKMRTGIRFNQSILGKIAGPCAPGGGARPRRLC